MSDTNTRLYVKQVWRQKGDVQFDRIPFKEANKAQELSRTTRPVLLLETKANGGSGAVFAIGRVADGVVQEESVEYANGEHLYHVPFTYEFVLDDKKSGVTREELQELTGQKFAPQAKGGLYEIDEAAFEQVQKLLIERNSGIAQAAATVEAPVKKAAKKEAKQSVVTASNKGSIVLDALRTARALTEAHPELRLTYDQGLFIPYPAALLDGADLVSVQQAVSQYIADESGQTVEADAASDSPKFAKLIALAERLVSEGRYDTVQLPTVQKAFYREGSLPHPYLAIELEGPQGHHVLGIDGTLYTVDGRSVQHFLGL